MWSAGFWKTGQRLASFVSVRKTLAGQWWSILKWEGDLTIWASVSHLTEASLGNSDGASFRKLVLLFVAGLVTGSRSTASSRAGV